MNVAIKFFDIDPLLAAEKYRIEAFKREHEILETLLGKDRCLQLSSTLKNFKFSVPAAAGGAIDFLVSYFAVQWIDSDIDDYFFGVNGSDAISKLKIFNEIVLAIEALHRSSVFHRDIKADNLRAIESAVQRVVVAIDLGTAARYSSSQISAGYASSVGAPAYASPEALCGLAGCREVARFTDVYALGCLLYELFNRDYFGAVRGANTAWVVAASALCLQLSTVADEADKLKIWRQYAGVHSRGIPPIHADGVGSTLPPGIAPIINQLVVGMTHFDYQQRLNDLSEVRRRVWLAIRLLENEKAYQRKLARIRAIRQQKIARVLQGGARALKHSDGVQS